MGEDSEIVIDRFGSLFKTRRTKDKAFWCPLCGYGEESPIFFTEEDLISHISRHEIQRRKESERGE
ncbi:MAG: hypothetical protein QW039_03300 [Fervidicoccaceae archaeon]